MQAREELHDLVAMYDTALLSTDEMLISSDEELEVGSDDGGDGDDDDDDDGRMDVEEGNLSDAETVILPSTSSSSMALPSTSAGVCESGTCRICLEVRQLRFLYPCGTLFVYSAPNDSGGVLFVDLSFKSVSIVIHKVYVVSPPNV